MSWLPDISNWGLGRQEQGNRYVFSILGAEWNIFLSEHYTIIKFGSIVMKRVLCHQKVLMYSHGQKKIKWCFKDC